MTHAATCAVEEREGVCGAPTQAFLCTKHTDELVYWLWDIGGVQLGDSGQYCVSLLDELDTTICRDDKVGGASIGVVVRMAETPLMFNERASQAKSDLCRAVVSWTKLFAEENDHLQFDVATIEQAARWMAGFPNLLASHPSAVFMHAELRDHVRNARCCVDRPAERVYAGICDGWNEAENKKCVTQLFAVAGHREVTCRDCGSEHVVRDRQRQILLGLRSRVATARVISGALNTWAGVKVNVKTIRTWTNRGLLENHAAEGEVPEVEIGATLDLAQASGLLGASTCADAA